MSQIPKDIINFENWVSQTIEDYEKYHCMKVFGNHEMFEGALKEAVDNLSFFNRHGLSTEARLERSIWFEVEHESNILVKDISVFKPQQDFDMLTYCAEKNVTQNTNVAPQFQTIIQFSTRGQPYILFISAIFQDCFDRLLPIVQFLQDQDNNNN